MRSFHVTVGNADVTPCYLSIQILAIIAHSSIYLVGQGCMDEGYQAVNEHTTAHSDEDVEDSRAEESH